MSGMSGDWTIQEEEGSHTLSVVRTPDVRTWVSVTDGAMARWGISLTPRQVYQLREILRQCPADCGDHRWFIGHGATTRLCTRCGHVEDIPEPDPESVRALQEAMAAQRAKREAALEAEVSKLPGCEHHFMSARTAEGTFQVCVWCMAAEA